MAMNNDDQSKRNLNRRSLLQGGSAALLGMGALWGSSAVAAPLVGKPRVAKGNLRTRGGTPAPTLLAPTNKLGPAEQDLARQIAAAVKHASVVAAANPDARFLRGSYAGLTQEYVRKIGSKERNQAKIRATRMLSAPVATRQRTFGKFAAKTVKEHQNGIISVDRGLAKKATDELLSRQRRFRKGTANLSKHGLKKIEHAKYSKVGFFLNEVKCFDETDGEAGDSDEVDMGGVAISPTGTIVKIKAFEVSDDFDKGERVRYYNESSGNFDPADRYRGRALAVFDLNEAGLEFPGSYSLSLTMVETDNGGFASVLNNLWEKVADDVKKAIVKAGKAYLGDFGAILAAIVNLVLDEVVAFLINLFTGGSDDLIASVTGNLGLGSPNKSYFSGLSGRELSTPTDVWAAQRQKWNFHGDGGRYRIKMHWRVWS